MSNPFTQILSNKPKKNKFDLSHEKKLSLKFGNLYPVLHEEVLPSDSFQVSTSIFMRFAPLLAPVMHRIDVYVHYFFVPNRLVWEEWELFITGGEDQAELDATPPVFPTHIVNNQTYARYAKGTLSDYFGIPITSGVPDGTINISALPFRAYQLIYNEYYRDQNLINKIPIDLTSAVDNSGADLTTIRERAWSKDYFTTALPWTQKGGESELPVTSVPTYQATSLVIQTSDDGNANGDITATSGQLIAGAEPSRIENLSNLTGNIKINDLRSATRLQTWLERQARGGTRYIEQIFAHFGQRSSDSRLQRPEYLGGGKQVVQISEVMNNTATDTANTDPGAKGEFYPAGHMSGKAISAGSNMGFKRSFEEHGQIIGIMSVIPKRAYSQGLHQKWRKLDKFDYFWPDFAHLGEQEVYMTELYCNWSSDSQNNLAVAFGYQQRSAEYKYSVDTVHGDFRDTLAFWHLAENFSTKPFLNQTFITCRPRTDIFAVDDGTDYLWAQVFHKISAVRPIPYFSIPEL